MELLRQEKGISKIFILLSIGIVLPFYLTVPILIWALYKLLTEHHQVWREHRYQNRWWLLFIVYSMGVALFRQNYIGIMVSLVFLLFAYIFTYYRSWIQAHIYLRFLHAHILSSALLALWSIFIYLRYSLTHGYGIFYIFLYNNIQTRAEATFFNANYYGLYCLFVIAMILYMYRKVHVKQVRIIYGVILLLNLIAILLTGSRWLWPSLTFVIGVFYIMLNLSWLKYILAGVSVVIVAILIKPNLLPRVDSLAYAFKDRWSLWSGGWGLFMWRPIFGTGAMAYMQYYYLFTDNGNMHSHNLFVDILANFGLIGAILLSLGMIFWMKRYRHLLHNKECRLEMVFLVTCILTIFFHGMMDVAILWVQTAYVALMLLTLPPDQVVVLSQITINNKQDFKKKVAFFSHQ